MLIPQQKRRIQYTQTIHRKLEQFAAAFSPASVRRKASAVLLALFALLAPNLFAAGPTAVWVDPSYGPTNPNDNHTWGQDAFSSIQNAINAVGAGATVNVAAGIYVEQLNIANDITVAGQGAGTVIQSPATLAVNYNYNGTDNRAIVFVHDTANAVLQNLTVDGAAQGDNNPRFLGVSFYHAGGKALNLTVQNVRLSDALFGMQSGIGLYAENRGETTQRNVEVGGCVVTNFQKGGMTFNGNVAVNAHDNIVTGAGSTGLIAQNGIQVGYGASGTVANNQVSGCYYTGADAACGIYVYQAGATVTGNLLPNNQHAVSVDAPTTAMGAVTLNGFEGSQFGVYVENTTTTVNAVSNWWGSASGPTIASNQGGTGVAVSDNVSYSPWLVAPTQVWVNLSYGSTSQNDGHVWGVDAFSSIQAAVNAVGVSGIVNVAAGTYDERVIVQTAGVTVRGAGVSSIVTGTASAPAAGVTPAVFKVAASGVTISNFMIQVNFAYNHSGVHSSGLCSGLTIANNTIVASVTGTPAFSYGLRNAIAVNPSLSTAGYTSFNGGYAGVSVTGNTIQGTGSTYFRAGIQMDYCGGIVSGNTSTTVNHDFISRFASQGDITVTNNTFLGGGAQFGSFNPGAGTVTIAGNVFDNSIMQPATGAIGTGASLRLSYYAEVSSVNNNVVVSGNTFRNHRWGVSVEDFKNVTFDHNTFTPKANATDYIHMTFNTKVITSTSANSALNMFPVGATLTGNTFNGSGSAGGTALAFYNHRSSDAVFGTYTLGTPGNENTFNAGIANFIALDASSGASSTWTGFGEYAGIPSTTMAPWSADLDVQNNQFDVGSGLTLPSAMTTADLFEVENRIQHKVDNSALGLVRVKAANLFVTQNSGSIQRGIDAATAGDTVNVAAGTFGEQLNISNDITVTGQGAGVTVVQPQGSLAVNNGGYQAVVLVHDTPNAVVQNLTVDGGTAQSDPYKRFAGVVFYHAGGHALGLTVQNFKLSDPSLASMQTGYGIYADNQNETTLCNVEVAGCQVSNFQKNGLVLNGNLAVNVHGNQVQGAGSTGAITQNGIVVMNGATGAVANNAVGGFAYTGDNEACGILVWQAGATISGNLLANNQDAVYVSQPTPDMGAITLNSFAGCQTGVGYDGTAPLQAGSNWWGSASGPGNVSNSGGATVSYNVVFGPWLADGTDTSNAVGFQPNPTLVDQSAPTQVWVNQAYGPSEGNDGHLWGYNAFSSIQDAVNGIGAGGTVNVSAGTYSENVVLTKPLELAGSGQANTVIVPGSSSPIGSGGECDLFGGGTGSIVLLVQANDVKIHDLTVDGDNPNLTSGIVVGGADIDARIGILTDNRNNLTFDRLDVRNVTVKNIYLRGIQNFGGSDINIVSNTVQNVWGSTDCSIGIFNRDGSGMIAYNTVSGTPDAISANHSRGTQFFTNTVTLSGSGIHTDNNGDSGGVADAIKGNLVLNGIPDSSGNAYGIWVFAPYAAVAVEGNTVSNVLYGLSAMGQGTSVAPIFTGNTVLGANAPGSVGICVDTSLLGFGSANVEAVLSGNLVSNNVTGVLLNQETGSTASLIASNNWVTAGGVGFDLNAGQALLQNNNLTGNSVAAIRVENGATVDAGNCGSDVTGLGVSSGGNDLSGYLAGDAKAIINANVGGLPAVIANHDNFGATSSADIIPNAFSGAVEYSQAPAVVSAPPTVTVGCVLQVPAGATDLAGFVAQGGYFSASAGSVAFSDTVYPVGNGTITRTYTVTDTCGLAQTSSQTIVVSDTTPPVIGSVADVSVTTAQPRDPYFTGTPTATDGCGTVTLTYNDNRSGLTGCNGSGTIVRTWTATDASGNVSTSTQNIIVKDVGVPEFVNVPANIVATSDPGRDTAVVNYAQPTAKELSFSQGFEDAGWTSGDAATMPSVDWNNYNSAVYQVASETDGITSRTGTKHAVIDSTQAIAAGQDIGAFSRLGGYSAVFGAGFRVAQDVYLNLDDAAVKANTYGWDLSAASSDSSGGYGRDFVFHVASDSDGQLLVAADNGSSLAKPENLASGNHGTVTTNGWYTFEWVFRNNTNVLAVDCNLRAADGTLLWSQTLSSPSDTIPDNVGGNRYLWFTYLAVDKLAIDNTVLERTVPVTTDIASGSTFHLGTNTVACTATDACGNITTNSFTVTVTDSGRPTLSMLSCADGKATIEVRWVTGYPVVIEASSDLVHWAPVYSDAAPCTWVDTNAGAAGCRFYRAVSGQ